jgi:hypothetical protein
MTPECRARRHIRKSGSPDAYQRIAEMIGTALEAVRAALQARRVVVRRGQLIDAGQRLAGVVFALVEGSGGNISGNELRVEIAVAG